MDKLSIKTSDTGEVAIAVEENDQLHVAICATRIWQKPS